MFQETQWQHKNYIWHVLLSSSKTQHGLFSRAISELDFFTDVRCLDIVQCPTSNLPYRYQPVPTNTDICDCEIEFDE